MQLGEFFLLITTKGVDAFNAATGAAQKGMQSLERAGLTSTKTLDTGLKAVTDSMGKLGGMAKAVATTMAGAVTSAMVGATVAVGGFATAGIAASVQGERLTFQLSLLARQVGSLFIPAVEAATKVASFFTDILQKLSGDQQSLVGSIAGLAGGLTMIASGFGVIPGTILAVVSAFSLFQEYGDKLFGPMMEGIKNLVEDLKGPLMSAFESVWGLVKAIGATLADFGGSLFQPIVSVLVEIGAIFADTFGMIADVVKAVWPVIDVVVKGITLVLKALLAVLNGVATVVGKVISMVRSAVQAVTGAGGEGEASPAAAEDAPKKPGKARQELTPKGAGFEAVTAAFSRIQQSIANTFSPEKAAAEQADRDKEQMGLIREVRDAIMAKPAGAGV
jgi:hypothetical protein